MAPNVAIARGAINFKFITTTGITEKQKAANRDILSDFVK